MTRNHAAEPRRRAINNRIASGDFTCLVIKGDCIEVLPHLLDNCIDLTVTDPAYESLERHRAVGTTTRLKKSKASSNVWFTPFPNVKYGELFTHLLRVHCNNTHCYMFCDTETEVVALTGVNPYTEQPSVLSALSSGWRAWPSLTWVKTKKAVKAGSQDEHTDTWLQQEHVRSGMGYHWRRSEERILFLEKGKRKLNNLGWPNVMCGTRAGKGQFPTEKPENIIERLILNSTNEGDVVLDTFAGSGVVGRMAVRLGRKAILIDLDISWIVAHPIPGMEVVDLGQASKPKPIPFGCDYLYDQWKDEGGRDAERLEWDECEDMGSSFFSL